METLCLDLNLLSASFFPSLPPSSFPFWEAGHFWEAAFILLTRKVLTSIVADFDNDYHRGASFT